MMSLPIKIAVWIVFISFCIGMIFYGNVRHFKETVISGDKTWTNVEVTRSGQGWVNFVTKDGVAYQLDGPHIIQSQK